MSWVLANLPTIAGHLLAHLLQAVPAIIASFVLAIPIARLARVARPLRAVLVTGSSLLYAVPSLALFVILPIILATGIRDPLNVIVALTLYGLALLVPATADALDAVDARVLDAATAMGIQGSGWAVLAYDSLSGKLVTFQLFDQQGNVPVGTIPLFMVDMWEHAFYLDYLNVKADYVKAVWNIANWQDVAERLADAVAKAQGLIVR